MEFFKVIKKAFVFVFSKLPDSPIQKFLTNSDTSVIKVKWIKYLNWFFPVGACLDLLTAVLACWGVYLLVRWILGFIGLHD